MPGPVPGLEHLGDIAGKSVLLRADFNVPIIEMRDGTRMVRDDFRIRAALPTIAYLQEHGAVVTACTHLGRPKGAPDPRYDVGPVRERLALLAPGVTLLENLRFSPGEVANDPAFVDRLVAGHDCYVNDAFGSCHRAHASIVGPPARLPSAAGRLVEREVDAFARLLLDPPRPFVAVIGGSKVEEKLGLLRSLVTRVDELVVGGGMAYTFLAALGHDVGRSLFEPHRVADCLELLAGPVPIHLPVDLVAIGPDGKIGEEGSPDDVAVVGRDVPEDWDAVDIGPQTALRFREVVLSAKSLFWNGPVGVFEDPRFALGTRAIAEAVTDCTGFTVVGGGDSVAALDRFDLAMGVDFVSTGGGASLELIEHGDLPGLAALRAAAAGAGA